MDESIDTLFKLADNAAPPEGRVMPPMRTYPKSGETVSVEEAVARMKSRRAGRLETIAGGLDDTSDAVRLDRKPGQTGQAGKGEQTGKSGSKGAKGGRESKVLTVEDVVGHEVQMTMDIGKVHNTKLSRGNSLLASPSRKVTKTAEELLVFTRMGVKEDMQSLLSEMVPGLVKEAMAESSPEKTEEEKPDLLGSFMQGSHRVTYLIQGMKFTAGCLHVSVDRKEHCVVVVSRMGEDSTFVPQMRAELEMEVDGEAIPGRMFYFGMRFDIAELGLSFVGFLYDETQGVEEASEVEE